MMVIFYNIIYILASDLIKYIKRIGNRDLYILNQKPVNLSR